MAAKKPREKQLVLRMEDAGIGDIALVGGKNASLGEMMNGLASRGVCVPPGFIVTAESYRLFLRSAGLDGFVRTALAGLDARNIGDLARRGRMIRRALTDAEFPSALAEEIAREYADLEKRHGKNIDVAVRSSATAEDLPGASFAGEHETYLGVRGARAVVDAVRSAFASLFTDRAIAYRQEKGFDHFDAALAVGVQKMVRSDRGAAGVMFTLDPESGFRNAIVISASWGLGETVVQGKVTPDEYIVFKPGLEIAENPVIAKRLGEKKKKTVYAGGSALSRTKLANTSLKERDSFVLSDAEIKTLACRGMEIERHYSVRAGKWTPMDIEWAKDGKTGELFIVQARPETIHAGRDFSKVSQYIRKGSGKILARGISVGSKIVSGNARLIGNAKDISRFRPGDVLVAPATDPDWEPVMKLASALVTDKGGRTSHAAIIARELGIPAVVGTGSATKEITNGTKVTIDAAGSEGLVFEGIVPFEEREEAMAAVPRTKTKLVMNIATPDTAFAKSFLPNAGVGLAREEFIIASSIGIHPLALMDYPKLDAKLRKKIDGKTRGWKDKKSFYIETLASGIAKIGAAFYPNPVIVRFSDFKTNEYRALLGGDLYEPEEENPMLGWRGAARYYDPKFKNAFLLECEAVRRVREAMGLANVIPMVPFCRTPEEGARTLGIMAEQGLITKYAARKRGLPEKNTVPAYVMCEIPSNVILADEFLELFDGMSIGSNDLTQLMLGLDRDSGTLAHIGDAADPAVKKMIAEVIKKCKAKKKYVGICGQAPSDHPEFAEFLIEQGIESISLNPDTIIKTAHIVAEKEKRMRR